MGKEWRVGRGVFLSTVFLWRTQLYQPALVTLRQLSASILQAAKLLHVEPEVLERGWRELEEFNYVQLAADGWDSQIRVAPTAPKNPEAGLVRRLLMGEHHPMNCPWCNKPLPRMTFAGNAPPPRNLWEISGFEQVKSPASLTFNLVAWSIFCTSCDKKRHFVAIDLPAPGTLAHAVAQAVLSVIEVSGTSRRPPTRAYDYTRLLGTRPDEARIEAHLDALGKELAPLVAELPGGDARREIIWPQVVTAIQDAVGPCASDRNTDPILKYTVKVLGGEVPDWRVAWWEAMAKSGHGPAQPSKGYLLARAGVR